MKLKKFSAFISATVLAASTLGTAAFAESTASTTASDTASSTTSSAASEASDTTSTPANVPTGVEGMAAILGVAAVAAGALVVAKKKK